MSSNDEKSHSTPVPAAEEPHTTAATEQPQSSTIAFGEYGAPVSAEQSILEADSEEVSFISNDDDDTDSAFDSQSIISSTASLRSDMVKHREEHGRRYIGFEGANYVLPMDEMERDRLDFQTHLAWLSLGKRQTLAPFGILHRVLDAGCGTGLWTIDFADAHQEAEVIGVDLAPVQPDFVPHNLRFEVDDLEQPWTFTQKFDYIHSQLMIGAFKDWPKFINQCFEFTEPGGYLEVHDIDFVIKCDDGSLPEDAALRRWHKLMHEAAATAGYPLDAIKYVPGMVRNAGFEDVVAIPIKWPINSWPKDPKHKEVGQWASENFIWGCESMSLALFTRVLGWSAEEVTVFMAQVRADLKNKRYHAYWNFWAIYGRKPGEARKT